MVYHYYWKYFLRLEKNELKENDVKLLSELMIDLFKKNQFEFKILKNLDFSTINKNQILFLNEMTRMMLVNLSE